MPDILAARARLSGQADATPMTPSPFLLALTGRPFLLKLETMQPMGAFK